MTKHFLTFFSILFLTIPLAIYSQSSFVNLHTINPDTLAKSDSLENIFSKPYFGFKDVKGTSFTSFADIYHHHPGIQAFSFLDMGRPVYLAPLNMFPQQAVMLVDGLEINDHIHGMYNTRMLSLDHVNSVSPFSNDSAFTMYDAPVVLDARTRFLRSKEAYTRLKYLQGDFGYFDLNILFAREYGKDFNLQLAGYNRGYDGWASNTANEGFNYRARAEYKINPKLTVDGNFTLNREKTGMFNYSNFRNYKYYDGGENYTFHVYLNHDSLAQRWTVATVDVNSIRRTNRSSMDSFEVKDRFDRYRFLLEHRFKIGRSAFQVGGQLERDYVWGSAFPVKFIDDQAGINASAKIRLMEHLAINLSGQTVTYRGKGIRPSSTGELTWFKSRYALSVSYNYTQRVPNALEYRYNFDGFSGNRGLNDEKYEDITLKFFYTPEQWITLQGKSGISRLADEIIYKDKTFINRGSRSWAYIEGETHLHYGVLDLSVDGHFLSADTYISPRASLSATLSYHDKWFNRIGIDIYGTSEWNDRHNTIYYNPVIQRFYNGTGETGRYMTFSFKAVATVSDAEIFLEMDNLRSTDYYYIYGYYEYYRRVRFGVNWVLWD